MKPNTKPNTKMSKEKQNMTQHGTTGGATSNRKPIHRQNRAKPLRTRSSAGQPLPGILVGIGDTKKRRDVVSALEELDRDVVAVGDGFHVVERIADAILSGESKTRPGLIIIDSILVGCTGLSLLEGLRDLGWDVPVILLTPAKSERIRRQAWENGATGVFMNPLDARELCVFSKLLLEASGDTTPPVPPLARNRGKTARRLTTPGTPSRAFGNGGASANG